jgi:predicted nuclease with TOPRIM domain
MPTASSPLARELDRLKQALDALENAMDRRFEREQDFSEAQEEVRRMNVDRSRLAQELDQAQDRANRMEEANREVSRRLVTSMETIRAVLDR